MSWIEATAVLGNIGEFIGAIAVVFTLVYLTIQVRHGKESLDANTSALEEQQRLARAQAYLSRASSAREQNLRLAESPDLSGIIVRYHTEGVEALTPPEYLRFEAYQRALFIELDNLHFQAAQGYMEEGFIDNYVISSIRFWGPVWRQLGLSSTRSDFQLLFESNAGNDDLQNINKALTEKFAKLRKEDT